jgi:hypothetical protein
MEQDNQIMPQGGNNMREEFGAHLQELDKRNGALMSDVTTEKENIKQEKIKMLREFYSKLREVGVDPTDVNSISAYLQKLEQNNPDSVLLIQIILDILDPEKDLGEEPSIIGAQLMPGVPVGTVPENPTPTVQTPPEPASPGMPI